MKTAVNTLGHDRISHSYIFVVKPWQKRIATVILYLAEVEDLFFVVAIVNASTNQMYTDDVLQFRAICEKYLNVLKYVESTILDQVKEKFVCAWTDQVMHLEHTTSNWVEFAHACLKNWLANSKGDLITGWEVVNHMILNQYNEIQTTFGRSIRVLEHKFKDNMI